MWITWRRYRVRLILLTLYVLALIICMLLTEHEIPNLVTSCGSVVMLTAHGRACVAAGSRVFSRDRVIVLGIVFVPVLMAVSLGAPLIASEFEAKTNRLAWAQGVTRTRWLLVAWLTLTIPAVIMMSLLELTTGWWAAHVYGIAFAGQIQGAPTGLTGVAPVAIALFGLSLGTCIGAFFRSSSMSAAATLIGLAVVLTYISIKVNGPQPLPQWGVAGIYVLLAGALLGLSVWAVRRWRA